MHITGVRSFGLVTVAALRLAVVVVAGVVLHKPVEVVVSRGLGQNIAENQ